MSDAASRGNPRVGRPLFYHAVVAGSILLAAGACAPVGEPLGPVESNIGITGTVLVDGAPYVGLVRLGIDDLNPQWLGSTTVFRVATSAAGMFEIRGRVNPIFCDRLWVIIEQVSPWYEHPVTSCGEQGIDIDASINTRVSGTVTLDGSPFAGADIYFAFEQDLPTAAVLRRFGVEFADAAGEYGFELRVAPENCDKLVIWWQSHGVDQVAPVPGCGTHVVDVAATS